MKAALIILFAVCAVDCRKLFKPIDKNANIDFINMEMGGGMRPPAPVPPTPAPAKVPAGPPAQPATTKAPVPAAKPVTTVKPVPTPAPTPPKPVQPVPPKPQPVNPAAPPTTTPLPGSVKHLITFYDSKGQGSVIRPYTYSQAVKQG